MSTFESATTSKKLNEANKRLVVLYEKIPSTKGCLENIYAEKNPCKAWCCEQQNPQLLYVEFYNAWSHMLATWCNEDILQIIDASLKTYLSENAVKGCVFFDDNRRLCRIHERRPYNCRIYGITPDDEFKPRYEKLKVIYPHIRYQCNLVSTQNNNPVTKNNIENWWLELKSIEMGAGIKIADIHDDVGGSYRTFYDHILLHLLGEAGMEYLTYARLNFSATQKTEVVKKSLEQIKKFLLSIQK
jgi:Fe-S-cluster containining protein